jgi:hypothetical protein
MGYFCEKCEKIKNIMKLYDNVLDTLEFVYIRNEVQIDNKKNIIKKVKQVKRGKELDEVD